MRGGADAAPAALVERPTISAEDRAVLARALADDDDDRELDAAFDAVIARLFSRLDALPFDASAAQRIDEIREVHRLILDALVDEDPVVAVAYAVKMQRMIPVRGPLGPLSDDEVKRLYRSRGDIDDATELRRAQAWGFVRDQLKGQVEWLELRALAERAVQQERHRVGSAARHPPTSREVAAAVVRRIAAFQSDGDGENDLFAELGSPCHKAVTHGRRFLQALYVAQMAHHAEFDVYGTDPDAIGVTGLPPAFQLTIDQTSNDGSGFVARLRGKHGSPTAGEIWSITEENVLMHEARGCTPPIIDDAVFAPVLTDQETRALADLIASRAIVADEAADGVAAFAKVIDAYPQREGTLGPYGAVAAAAVLVQTLRAQRPDWSEDDIVARVEGFLPWKTRKPRPLTSTETDDLIWLSVRTPQPGIQHMRLSALLNLITPTTQGARSADDLVTPLELQARVVLQVLRTQRPEAVDAYLQQIRPMVCRQLRNEEGLLSIVVDEQRVFREEHGHFAPTIEALFGSPFPVLSFTVTFEDVAPDGIAADAVMPPESVIADHHLRVDALGLRMVHDACAAVRDEAAAP